MHLLSNSLQHQLKSFHVEKESTCFDRVLFQHKRILWLDMVVCISVVTVMEFHTASDEIQYSFTF